MTESSAQDTVSLQTVITRIPYAAYLGITLKLEQGELVTCMPFEERIVGNARLPAIHGGVVGAFLELAALLELLHRSPQGALPKPIDFNVNYLRSAGPRETFARARVVKHGKRIANVTVEAWQADEGRPVASGHGNFLL